MSKKKRYVGLSVSLLNSRGPLKLRLKPKACLRVLVQATHKKEELKSVKNSRGMPWFFFAKSDREIFWWKSYKNWPTWAVPIFGPRCAEHLAFWGFVPATRGSTPADPKITLENDSLPAGFDPSHPQKRTNQNPPKIRGVPFDFFAKSGSPSLARNTKPNHQPKAQPAVQASAQVRPPAQAPPHNQPPEKKKQSPAQAQLSAQAKKRLSPNPFQLSAPASLPAIFNQGSPDFGGWWIILFLIPRNKNPRSIHPQILVDGDFFFF